MAARNYLVAGGGIAGVTCAEQVSLSAASDTVWYFVLVPFFMSHIIIARQYKGTEHASYMHQHSNTVKKHVLSCKSVLRAVIAVGPIFLHHSR